MLFVGPNNAWKSMALPDPHSLYRRSSGKENKRLGQTIREQTGAVVMTRAEAERLLVSVPNCVGEGRY